MIAILTMIAFVSSVGAVRAFLLLSQRRLVDRPGTRSSHSRPTPTGGGFAVIAIFLATAAVLVTLGVVPGGPRWWAVALCASVLGVLGLVDDAFNLPRSARYAAHVLVAIAVVRWVGHPWDSGCCALGGAIASVVFVTGLINAFNFMDGIDALVAATGVIIVAFLAWFTRDAMWMLLAASYSGFLVYNAPPARIFMGDAGSTALGGLVSIAVLSGRATLEPRHLLIFAPLIGDSAYTVARRLGRGENVFIAHHSHLYQRLLRAGHSHGRISGGYAAMTIVLGFVGMLGNNGAAVCGLIACVVLVVGIELYLARRGVPFARAQNRSGSAPATPLSRG